MSTARLEAFSDGVIAVAITLLVLDLRVPDVQQGLGHALLREWPSYAAYVISFITIGIIWINHHVMLGRLRAADRSILSLNLLLLMSIGVLPFATSLMSSYLKRSQGEHLAAAVYAGAFLVMGVLFLTLNRNILHREHLLGEAVTPERQREILRRTMSGIAPYALAVGMAFVSPYVTLAICAAVAVYYALPVGSGG